MKQKASGGAHTAPRRRKKTSRRIATVVCCALALVILACAGYMLWESPPDRDRSGLSTPEPTLSTAAPSPTTAPTAEPSAEPTPEPTAAPVVNERYTFLVVGTDKGGGNTDTIMVGCLDATAHTIDVVNIPRDTLVNISSGVKRVNTLYALGVNSGGSGPDRLKAGIRDLLGFDVDYYAVVDLQAFVEVVDAMGGVYYDVPIDMYYEDPIQNLSIAIPKGYQWLSGEEALKVVRFRSGYAQADIGRIGTQQDFLKSVAKQLLSVGNIPNLTKCIDIFTNNVDTDLTAANLSFFARQFLLCGGDDVSFHTMPGNYAVSIGGFSYVSMYVDEWLEMVNDFLNPYEETVTRDNVNILTSDGVNFYSTVGYVAGGEDSFYTMDQYLVDAGLSQPGDDAEPDAGETDGGGPVVESGDAETP